MVKTLDLNLKVFNEKRAMMSYKVWSNLEALNAFKEANAGRFNDIKEHNQEIVSLCSLFNNLKVIESSNVISFETETFNAGDKQRLLDLMTAEVLQLI